MTVPATNRHIEYTSNGSTTVYTYPFRIDRLSEMEVRIDEVVKTASLHYTVTGIGVATGGTVILTSPAPTGKVISLRGIPPYEQLLHLVPNGALPAASLEGRLDEIVKMVQSLDEELSRRPSLFVGAPAVRRNLDFPRPGLRKVIGWSATEPAKLVLYDPAITQVIIDTTSGIARGKSVVELGPGTFESTESQVAEGLAPGGTRILGVTMRILTDFSDESGLNALDLGGFDIQDGWGSNLSAVTPFASSPANFVRGDMPIAIDAGDILLTPKGGGWGFTGLCKITLHWETYSPDA